MSFNFKKTKLVDIQFAQVTYYSTTDKLILGFLDIDSNSLYYFTTDELRVKGDIFTIETIDGLVRFWDNSDNIIINYFDDISFVDIKRVTSKNSFPSLNINIQIKDTTFYKPTLLCATLFKKLYHIAKPVDDLKFWYKGLLVKFSTSKGWRITETVNWIKTKKSYFVGTNYTKGIDKTTDDFISLNWSNPMNNNTFISVLNEITSNYPIECLSSLEVPNCKEISFKGCKLDRLTRLQNIFEDCDDLVYVNFAGINLEKLTFTHTILPELENIKLVDFSECLNDLREEACFRVYSTNETGTIIVVNKRQKNLLKCLLLDGELLTNINEQVSLDFVNSYLAKMILIGKRVNTNFIIVVD